MEKTKKKHRDKHFGLFLNVVPHVFMIRKILRLLIKMYNNCNIRELRFSARTAIQRRSSRQSERYPTPN